MIIFTGKLFRPGQVNEKIIFVHKNKGGLLTDLLLKFVYSDLVVYTPPFLPGSFLHFLLF